MIVHLATPIRTTRITALRDALDAGASAGYIEFYTAPQPSTGGAAITTQIKIGTCVLSDPAGTISNGALTFSPISDDVSADADGNIAWARFYDGDGNWVMDGDCGNTSSSALVKFNTVIAVQGGVVQILSGSISDGNP